MEPETHFQPIIREYIWDQRKANKKVRSRHILEYLKNVSKTRNLAWKWSLPTLCSYLRKMGYYHKQRKGYYDQIQEKPSIRAQVIKYILKIRQLREQKKDIYFQDETWVYTNEVGKFDWINDEDEIQPGARKSTQGPGARSIISSVIGPNGILPSSILQFRGSQEKRKDADYHSDMNSEVFLGWLEKDVFPHIKGSAICIDRATYHTTLTDETKPPKSNLKKSDVIDYILKHSGGKYSQAELTAKILVELKLIAKDVAPDPEMRLTALAKKFDVEIVMLPVAHPNLNIIEFVWARVKTFVCMENQVQSLVTAENIALRELKRVHHDTYSSILTKKVIPYENEILEIYEKEMQEEDEDEDDMEEDDGDV